MLYYKDLPSKKCSLKDILSDPALDLETVATPARERPPQRLDWKRSLARTAQVGLLTASLAGSTLVRAGTSAQQDADFLVNTYTTNFQQSPSAAMDADGDFVIAWQSEFQDGSNYGVYAQRYNADGTPDGFEFPVNTYTTGNQQSPSVAMDADGDFVVVWASSQDGDQLGIYARRYNANGTAKDTTEFQVNTYTTDYQYRPSVAMDADGDFVVAWESVGQDAAGWNYGIYAQRYAADGTPTGDEFRVNTYTTNNQKGPSVAVDADGDFVIAWQSESQDGSNHGVYAQRYAADGTPTGDEFQVNTYTTSYQHSPSVAMDADGDFVIAWLSYGQDGEHYGIYAQRYTADGTPAGNEFLVNTYTTGAQYRPSVAMDADGDFVVAWQSFPQDSSDSSGVYAQRYWKGGTPSGSEFRVNSYTTGDQAFPSVGMDADGDFVVAWDTYEQDSGDAYGIYARQYPAPSTVYLPLVLRNSP